MADAFERTPLATRTADLARIGAREVPFLAQLSVRTRDADALGLPRSPNTWTALEGVGREALWLGPDEWLVVGPRGTASGFGGADVFAIADPVAMGLEGAACLVDVSANRTVLELRGDERRALLEQGCSVDLHPSAWRDGMCAQTLLAHVPVILQERGDATRVFVRPSFANWLLDWFVAVA
jgi:sarcosine oxidase subunit gamma